MKAAFRLHRLITKGTGSAENLTNRQWQRPDSHCLPLVIIIGYVYFQGIVWHKLKRALSGIILQFFLYYLAADIFILF